MTGKRIGYIRVSTLDQNPDRQLQGIELDKKFIDHASGTTINRPQFESMIDYARDDDIIYVHSMDRLARNVRDLLNIIDKLSKKNIEVHFIKENLIFNGRDSPMSNLLLMIMGAIAEFEYSLIRERQMEGIALAKKAGKYSGRKKSLTNEQLDIIKSEIKKRHDFTSTKSLSRIASEMNVSRTTLYRRLKECKLQT